MTYNLLIQDENKLDNIKSSYNTEFFDHSNQSSVKCYAACFKVCTILNICFIGLFHVYIEKHFMT